MEAWIYLQYKGLERYTGRSFNVSDPDWLDISAGAETRIRVRTPRKQGPPKHILHRPAPIDVMGLPGTSESNTLRHIADSIPTYADITKPEPSDHRDNETCRWVLARAGLYARKYPSLMPHMLDILHSTRNPDTELYHTAIDTFDEACRRNGIALDLED